MGAAIFVRQRRKVEDGEKKPRFRVVGVSEAKIKFFSKHLRKVELEQIAGETGVKIVYLDSGKGKRDGSGHKA